MEARMKANMQIINKCNMTDIFPDRENVLLLWEREDYATVSKTAPINIRGLEL
jgi:hypothetical protein